MRSRSLIPDAITWLAVTNKCSPAGVGILEQHFPLPDPRALTALPAWRDLQRPLPLAARHLLLPDCAGQCETSKAQNNSSDE